MTALECFNTNLPAAFAAHAEEALAIDTVLRVNVTGDGGGNWILILKGPTPICRPYMDADEPSVLAHITISAPDFTIYLGTTITEGLKMYLDKRTIITGPVAKEAAKARKAYALMSA